MKKVLITGVSSGIGQALAESYKKLGYEVFGLSRRPADVDYHLTLDISDHQLIETRFSSFIKEVRHFDLVILNAGVLGRIDDLKNSTLDELKKMMDINMWSNKIILDILFSDNRQIDQVIGLSSGAAVNGNRGWSGYSLSKAAFKMLIQLYSQEQEQCHFISLAPGLVDTAMQDSLCQVEDIDTFKSLGRIQSARGTEAMPSPNELCKRLPQTIEDVKSYESGSFIDIRKI